MSVASLIYSDIFYFRNLMRAGLDGVISALNDNHGQVFVPAFKDAVWTPAALGAAIGIVGTCLSKDRRSAPRAAVGGLIGSALGLGGSAAWASRHFTGTAAR